MSHLPQHTPDFALIRRLAKGMTMEALLWSAQDAMEAATAAAELEKAGCRVSKTEGYYTDEATVYMTEVNRRRQDPNMGQDGKCPCCKR